MARYKTLTTILLVNLINLSFCHRAIQPPVPGLPDNTDPTKRTPTTPATSKKTTEIETGPFLLDNYLAPSMQALAYYIELLQYESVTMTTIEPPFEGWEAEGGTTYVPPPTSPRPSTTTKSSTVWWKPPSTHSTIWWVPPTKTTTTKQTTTTTETPTRKPPTTTTTTRRTTTTRGERTTTTPWWHTTTTTEIPTTTKPVTWWSPPSWWTSSSTSTTTEKPPPPPTPSHKPGLFAPMPPPYRKPQQPNKKFSTTTTTARTTRTTRPARRTTTQRTKWPITTTATPYLSITSDKNFYSWFFQQKSQRVKPEFEYDFNFLDPLPGALIQDIIYEPSELPAIADIDNVNELLRVYDDNFGRYGSNTGKKRIPVTKPYVEFLMLYDLLKRDAKAMNLSKYEGYTPRMLNELAELSTRSAERQLHALFSRMLARGDVERSDIVNRVKSIIKDLENPNSITAKAMRYFPPLPFVL